MTVSDMVYSQHRVSSFKLADPTKPGHRRFIALWLVDPHKRIISTANIPPQQMSWWAVSLAASRNSKAEAKTELPSEIADLLQENGANLPPSAGEVKLPEEFMEMIRAGLSKNALPMSLEEAKEHRVKLMEERNAHMEKSEDAWQARSYSFCEH